MRLTPNSRASEASVPRKSPLRILPENRAPRISEAIRPEREEGRSGSNRILGRIGLREAADIKILSLAFQGGAKD
jgi:hypothetical protein